MSVFGTAVGIAALISLLALLVKYPLRRLGLHKLNAFFMKLHEAASGLFFAAAIAHMISGLREARKNPLAALTGLTAFAVSTVLIAACHMTKDAQKKMRWHRIYSLILTITAAGHVTAAAALKKN